MVDIIFYKHFAPKGALQAVNRSPVNDDMFIEKNTSKLYESRKVTT